MSDIDEEWVRTRAYMLWEREGRIDGRADDYWRRACQDYSEMTASADTARQKSAERLHAAGAATAAGETE